jgi:cytochrome c-type biogenesis protein CcmI
LIPRNAASSSGGSNAGKTFVDGGTMALWIVLALMTIGAMFAVLWPLRASVASDGRDDNDVAVYRDQLEEVERDRAAGLIGATEAEAARVEVSRRLLAAGAASSARSAAGDASPRPRRWAAAATLVMLPLGAVGLYLAIGRFTVRRDGQVIGTMQPSKRNFPVRDTSTTEQALMSRGLSQIYLSLGDVNPSGATGIRLYHKPLVLMIWLGAVVMTLGGALSFSDRRLRVGAPRPASRRTKTALQAAQ